MPTNVSSVSERTFSLTDLSLEFAEKKKSWGERAAEPALNEDMLIFRRQLANTLVAHVRSNTTPADIETARALVAGLAESGADDYAAPIAILNTLPANSPVRAITLLKVIALVPSWQWTNAPQLDEVPAWLLPVYAAYRFNRPRLLTVANQGAASAGNLTRAHDELARLIRANRGSSVVRASIVAYHASHPLPPEWAGPQWPEFAAARLRLIEALAGKLPVEEPLLLPRSERRLRLGIVTTSLSAGGALGSLLPLIERLDPSRFELVVLAFQMDGTGPLSHHLRSRGADLIALSGEGEASLQTLRDALLDAAVLVVDPDVNDGPVARLANQRVAALQVWHDGLGIPVGWPQIDLHLGGTIQHLDQRATMGARVALLPGAGPLPGNDPTGSANPTFTRQQLGLPADRFLFASLASLPSLTPEVQAVWATLLAQSPDTSLVVCLAAPLPSDDDLHRFAAQFGQILTAQGVAEERLMVVPLPLGTPAARKNFLAIADAALGTGGLLDPIAVLAATEAGVPFLALDDSSRLDRRAAGLLRLAGLDELIAPSLNAAVALSARLANDGEWRTALQTRWLAAAPQLAARHDSFAQSEAFGQLLEAAFDAIVVSREQFAATIAPMQLPDPTQADLLLSDAGILFSSGVVAEAERRARRALALRPDSKTARQLLARAAAARGAAIEAADLLLTSIELSPNDAKLWHELAVASVRASRPADAVMAIDSALRLDPQQIDSWLLLTMLVDKETVQQIADVLRQLAPENPRVKELLAKSAA